MKNAFINLHIFYIIFALLGKVSSISPSLAQVIKSPGYKPGDCKLLSLVGIFYSVEETAEILYFLYF